MIVHILLTILKVLGIMLAVILGLILLVLLLVLLVPLRYRLDGEFHEKKKAEVSVTWLFRLLSLCGGYQDRIYYSVKVFGKTILSSKPRKKKKGKKPPEAVPDGTETLLPAEETATAVPEVTGTSSAETVQTVPEAPAACVQEADTAAAESAGGSEAVPEEAPESGKKKKPAKEKKPKKEKNPKKEKDPRSLIERAEDFLDSLETRWESLLEKAEELSEKAEMGMEFLEDEENRKTFALIIRQLLKILRHIRPRKLEGYLTLGLEDPYTMGKVMSAAAFFWPWYQETFRLTPVFDEKVIDGEVSIRGHLRLGYIAVCAVRILLNKNFCRLLRMLLKRK